MRNDRNEIKTSTNRLLRTLSNNQRKKATWMNLTFSFVYYLWPLTDDELIMPLIKIIVVCRPRAQDNSLWIQYCIPVTLIVIMIPLGQRIYYSHFSCESSDAFQQTFRSRAQINKSENVLIRRFLLIQNPKSGGFCKVSVVSNGWSHIETLNGFYLWWWQWKNFCQISFNHFENLFGINNSIKPLSGLVLLLVDIYCSRWGKIWFYLAVNLKLSGHPKWNNRLWLF